MKDAGSVVFAVRVVVMVVVMVGVLVMIHSLLGNGGDNNCDGEVGG